MLRKKSVLLRFCITFLVIIAGLPPAISAQTPTVLAELFRNIDCANCQQPDNQFDSYVASNPGVVVIAYNNSTPNRNDPFYLASLPSSGDRDQFYGGSGGLSDPSAYIDGVFAGTGSNTELQWEADANAGISHPLNPIMPTVAYGPSGIDTISFTLGPHKLVVAYVAIIESKIYYDNTGHSYGTPPGNLWNNVFRTMLPGPNGSGQFSGIKNFTVVFDPSQYSFSGNPQNMSAVVFTEDAAATVNNSHQAEAIGVVSLAPPDGVPYQNTVTNRLIIPANPITRQGRIGIELQSSSEVQLTLSDLLGREVRTLVDGRMPSGQTSIELEGSGLAVGCYVAHLSVDGGDAGHAMLVIQQ